MRSSLRIVVVAASLVGTSVASAALFATFEPVEAKAGEVVTIRLGGTPRDFRPTNRVRPFQQPMTVFLVADTNADEIRSPGDPRLTKIATIIPDKNGRGFARFTVPDLRPGVYWPAYYCPGCAQQGNSTFFSGRLDRNIVPQFRGRLSLTIAGDPGSPGAPWVRWFVPAVVALLLVGAAVSGFWRAASRRHAAARAA